MMSTEESRLARTPFYSKTGLILESHRVRRYVVLGIMRMSLAASLGLLLFGFSFVPGTFEPTDTELLTKIVGGGGPKARSFKKVEYIATSGFLYDAGQNSLGYIRDAGFSDPELSGRRIPVYYSPLWKTAIYHRDDRLFLHIAWVSGALGLASLAFGFIFRKHLKLVPVFPAAPAPPRQNRR